MMNQEKLKTLIEAEFSWLFLCFELVLFGLALIPLFFYEVPEEKLIEIGGHVTSLVFKESNGHQGTFVFQMRETEKKTFAVTGLRDVDQIVFMAKEKTGSQLTLSVNSDDLNKLEVNIPVYELSSPSNTYLERSIGSKALAKSRLFSLLLGLVFILSGLLLFKRSYDEIINEHSPSLDEERSDSLKKIDPLLIYFVNHPAQALTLVFLSFVLSFFIFCSGTVFQVVVAFFSVVSSVFFGLYYKKIKEDPWVQQLPERDEERRKRLAQKLVTVVPKHLRAIYVLLKYGAKVDYVNNDGKTPLFISVESGQLDAVKLLLKHKANVDHADLKGNTCLMLAATQGDLLMVKLLLKYKAKVRTKNLAGRTAIDFADKSLKRNQAIVDLLTKTQDREKIEPSEPSKLVA